MNTRTERKIARDLAEHEAFEPPVGLLDKIKSEIPPDLGSRLPAAALREAREAEVVALSDRRMPLRRRWLLAASLIVTVSGGLLALLVVQSKLESPAEMAAKVEEERDAAAPTASFAPPVAVRASEPQAAGQATPAAPAAPAPAPATEPAADEERQQSLRALGYAVGEAGRDAAPEKKETAAANESAGFPVLQDRRRDEADGRAMKPKVAAARAPAPPPAPAQPVEVPVSLAESVEGGVVGGVAGGVVGGTPGGTPSGTRATAGVVITDLTVRGKSPADYDFDSFEEMQAGMTFRSAEAHTFVATAKDRLSTFGLDVDTASYTVARRYLRDGHLPPREAIRVEEFLNYFSYGDPPPARGDFALRAEGAASIFTQEPRTYLLRFNLRAREVKAEHRKPAVLTFVVDISGSMGDGNRLGLVQQSLALLLGQLRQGDQVGLVVYGSTARVILEPTDDRERIRAAIEGLRIDGATNAEAGIALGYEVAGRGFRPGAINRIFLCSDGVANVGATGPEAILQRIQRETKRGIELTTLGFGMGNYNDTLMEQLADKGNGRYAYIDDLGEARKVLVEELTGTLQTIAENAKVQVEFPPAAVERWRLIGYENRDIPDQKFRDDTVDAGEIGAGHSVTALYEVQLTPQALAAGGKIASLHLRYRVPGTGELRETVRDLRAGELAADWKNASPGFRLASLVTEFAETLRGSSYAGDLAKIQRRAQRVVGEMAKQPRGADVAEFARLVAEAARIKAAEKK